MAVAGAAAAVVTDPTSSSLSADVAVYGGTGGGCAAAIAASRSGAKNVVLLLPSLHVGGMNTGGLQHADPGNESTVGGIAIEFFTRTVAASGGSPPSPPPAPPSGPATYRCLTDRCIPLDFGAAGGTDARCGGACSSLAEDEWLAVTRLSSLSKDNQSLTVTLPQGQSTTVLKKSEKLSRFLPSSMVHEVTQGQVLQLSRPAVTVDDTCVLVAPTPFRHACICIPNSRDCTAECVTRMHHSRHAAWPTHARMTHIPHPLFTPTRHVSHVSLLHIRSHAPPILHRYLLVQLAPSPLRRLVMNTVVRNVAAPTPGLHPGAPPGWMYVRIAAHNDDTKKRCMLIIA
jgi:hypothetical protein